MVCSSFTFNVNDLHDFPGLTADECCVYSFISYWLIGFKKKKKKINRVMLEVNITCGSHYMHIIQM